MASKKKKASSRNGCLVVVGVLVLLAFIAWGIGQSFGVQEFTMGQVQIHDEVIDVYIADDLAERAQGLSGQTLADFPVTGMIFFFDDVEERRFWMYDMHFSIDIVWILDGRVVKTQERLLPPDLNDGEIQYMYSSPYEVEWVLELPAGGVEALELVPGTEVKLLP